MAGTSLFALLDDIATLLDDISVMTKVAAKKTAGVLGDDLALNADQVTGVAASRELPVVWAVGKGAMVNKVILVPAALLISAFIPWLVKWLLMLGGAFLCYEGFHKVYHHLFAREHVAKNKQKLRAAAQAPDVDMVEFEKTKIKGAIRTDFILSAEIIVLALSTVTAKPLPTQIGVLVVISIIVTFGVYGLVAGIVKLDDMGFFLAKRSGESLWVRGVRALGQALISAAPWLMKGLSVVGTVAMFLVGGGIFAHAIHAVAELLGTMSQMAGAFEGVAAVILPGILGIIVGAVVTAVVMLVQKLRPARGELDAEHSA